MTKSEFSRTGARRAGDNYQDIIAIEVLVQMLNFPDEYIGVRVEADDFGALDDVVVYKSDGSIEAKQVKFSAHPEEENDPYTWEVLLEQRTGKKGNALPSLLEKWGNSLLQLKNNSPQVKISASLITNRRLSDDIKSCLNDDERTIDFNKIPDEVQSTLIARFKSQEDVTFFFDNFILLTNQVGLDEYKKSIERIFITRARGEESGWLRLNDIMSKWVVYKKLPYPDGMITVEHIKNVIKFRELKSMPQDFIVPDDYVLPSEDFDEFIKKVIFTNDKTGIVITGEPGVGKSTYLSFLYQFLSENEIPVVRHHYYLSNSDNTASRFNYLKIIESLMADLRQIIPQGIAHEILSNGDISKFNELLDNCNEYYSSKDMALVVMLDGLDHVYRDAIDISELSRLFEYFSIERKAIFLVIGTQPLSNENLPKKLLDIIPRNEWVQIPNLDKNAILSWLIKNQASLDLPSQEQAQGYYYNEICGAFLEASHGSPLILKFTLQYLINQNIPITKNSIIQYGSYEGNGTDGYYSSIWNGLDQQGKFIIEIIAATKFEWPLNGIFECCDIFGVDCLRAKQSWEKIRHLMKENCLGWQPFHTSLSVFINGTDGYQDELDSIRSKIIKWLNTYAPEYLRWGYLWTLQAQNGAYDELINHSDREWVINSFTDGYPHSQINDILKRAIDQSLRQKQFNIFGHRSLMFDYVQNDVNPDLYECEELWLYAQLRVTHCSELPNVLLARIKELTDVQLSILAEWFFEHSNGENVTLIREELRSRFRYRGSVNIGYSNKGNYQALSNVIVLDPETTGEQIFKIIESFTDNNFAYIFSQYIACKLTAIGEIKTLRYLCLKEFKSNAQLVFQQHGFLQALQGGTDFNRVCTISVSSPLKYIYAKIINNSNVQQPIFSQKQYEFNSKFPPQAEVEQSIWISSISGLFFELLASRIYHDTNNIQTFIQELNGNSWLTNFIKFLINYGIEYIADCIEKRVQITICGLYRRFNSISMPRNHNDSGYHYKDLIISFMNGLSLDCLSLTSNLSTPVIDKQDIIELYNSNLCDLPKWLSEYNTRRKCWLTSESLSEIDIIYTEFFKTEQDYNTFRPSEIAHIANTFAMHGKPDIAKKHLRYSIHMSISHGHHKDTVLYQFLNSCELLLNSSVDYVKNLITPHVTTILNICNITDGDHTRYTPGVLFKLLNKIDFNLLAEIFIDLCQKEEYQFADESFCEVIKAMSFNTEVERQLGATILDEQNIKNIREKISCGNANAQNVLDKIISQIGVNPFECNVTVSQDDKQNEELTKRILSNDELEEYPPEAIIPFYEYIRVDYGVDTNDALNAWSLFWKGKLDVEIVKSALLELYNHDRYSRCSMLIFNLSVENDGYAKAWEWLYKAHCEILGWSSNAGNYIQASEIWQIVQDRYKDKWHEFIVESRNIHNMLYQSYGVHGHIEHLTNFLVIAGQTTYAKEFLSGINSAIIEITGAFNLIPFNFNTIDDVDTHCIMLLLSRLTWPSGSVRERTVNALAILLINPKYSTKVHENIFTWISKQKLEYVVCHGVLPFIKAKQLDELFCLPPVKSFLENFNASSILYKYLLSRLYTDFSIFTNQEIFCPDDAPNNINIDEVFLEWPDNDIFKSLRVEGNHIEKITSYKFNNQWAHELSIIDRTNFTSKYQGIYFWGRSEREHYMAYDCQSSHAMYSAYLRALGWLYNKEPKARTYAIQESINLLPVNIDLWMLYPCQMPQWWPIIHQTAKSSVDDISSTIIAKVKNKWESLKSEEWLPIHASGRVCEGNSIYDLSIYGILQKNHGNVTPQTDDIINMKPWWKAKAELNNTLGEITKGSISHCAGECSFECGDWEIIPCAISHIANPISKWQWWYFLDGLFFPNPLFFNMKTYNVEFNEGKIIFKTEGTEIAFWQNWANGVQEKQDANLPPRCGRQLVIKKSIIDKFCRTNNFNICWVFNIRQFHREHDYGKYKEVEFNHIFGASNIILP